MHFDNILVSWRRKKRKLKALLAQLQNDRPSNGQTVRVMLGLLMLSVLASPGIAQAKNNDAKQERKDERRADNADQRQNHQEVREVRKDNHKAAKDDRADNRVDNRVDNRENVRQQNQQNRAENRANQQANVRARNDAAQSHSDNKSQQRAENQANIRAEENARNRAAQKRSDDRAQNQAEQNSVTVRAQNRANERAHDQAVNDRRDDRHDDHRAQVQANSKFRWDNGLDNRRRYQTYRKYRNNWTDQRVYLNANLKRFNQLAALNQAKQQQLDEQMRQAYLSYHHNNYNGAYNWDNYSDPQFLDYLQTNKPSVLQTILSALGLGGNDDYLYSSNWNDERSQLSRNMDNIHQLAVEGRITSEQERQLLDQMRPEFMAYHNNNWNGATTWTQYSDPGFVDYLNKRQPSILTTVRDFLIR